MTTSPRRLAVLHGKFAKYLSWSQPFLYELVRELARHVDSVVVCSRAENLDHFPTRNLYRVADRVLTDGRWLALAAAEARGRWDPDLVHAHLGRSAIRLAPLAQALGSPLVVTLGGRDVHHELLHPVQAPLYEVLLRRAARVICVSEDLRRRVLERDVAPERVVVIRRGANLGRFAEVDREVRRDGSPLRLLMVGRLVEKKGHADALAAVRTLLGAGVAVRLTIVGAGELQQPLREACHELGLDEHVAMVGSTDADGVADHYRRADVLVHPSVTAGDGDAEGLPNVVVEAAATGLPVVATRHGGIGEAVTDGITGLLVAERDASGLAGAIRALAADPRRRLAMGRAAARLAREHFDLARQIERHLELYRAVVSEPDHAAGSAPSALAPAYLEALQRVVGAPEDTILGYLRELLPSHPATRRGAVFRAATVRPVVELRRLGLVVPAGIRNRLRGLLRRQLERRAARGVSGA